MHAINKRDFLTVAGAASAAAVALAGSSAQAQQATSTNVLIVYYSASDGKNAEKMAQGVAEGAKSVSGANVILKKVGEVTADDLQSADAVIVGSPVYFANMAGEVKTFFDKWLTTFNLFREAKMRNKVGAAFVTGASPSNGKETTMLAILEAMLVSQMIVVGGGGAFGASATTGPDSPGIDDKELGVARDLGKRATEAAGIVKRGRAAT